MQPLVHALSEITWIVLALISGFGILQILRALAIQVRNETMIHDLRVGVAEIQVRQFHAQMLRHGIVPNSEADEAPIEVGEFTEPVAGAQDRSSADGADSPGTADEPAERQAA
jgi:hypothetical protein